MQADEEFQENENTEASETDDDAGEGNKETLDFKALYEEEKVKKETALKAYKDAEASRNTIASALDKITKAETVSTQPPKSKDEEIDGQIDSLKKKWRDGEIDDEKYYDDLTDLKFKKNIKHSTATFLKEQEEKTASQQFETIQGKAYTALEEKYSGYKDKESVLYKEMEKILNEDTSIWGDLRHSTEMLKLAKLAESNLKASGKLKETESRQRREENSAGYSSFNSGSHQRQEASAGFSEEQVKIFKSKGLSDKHIKNMEEKNQQFISASKQVKSIRDISSTVLRIDL